MIDWVIRNLYWIIVACIAGCVLLAVYVMRGGGGGPRGPGGRPPRLRNRLLSGVAGVSHVATLDSVPWYGG